MSFITACKSSSVASPVLRNSCAAIDKCSAVILPAAIQLALMCPVLM